MTKINDKISDYSGHENLEILSHSYNFNNWLYQEILPSLKGDILEVGSGIGTFSEKIIQDFPNSKITLTDVSDSYIKELQKKFGNDRVSVYKLDLNQKSHYEDIGYKKFNSIVAVNVLEHVENDEYALLQLYQMLRKEGVLIILVPSHKFLFNSIDEKVGHFRRYSEKDLKFKIKKTQFTIDKMFCFNMLGIIGWYINGNLAKSSSVNTTAMRILDKLTPILKFSERVLGKKIGLSIICFLRK